MLSIIMLFLTLLGSSAIVFGYRPHLIALPMSFLFIIFNIRCIEKHFVAIFLLCICVLCGQFEVYDFDRYIEYVSYFFVGIIYFEVGFFLSKKKYFSNSLVFCSLFSMLIVTFQVLGFDFSFISSDSQNYSGLYGNINDYAVFIFMMGVLLWLCDSKYAKLILTLGFVYSVFLDRRLVLFSYILFYAMNLFVFSRRNMLFIVALVFFVAAYQILNLDIINFRTINLNTAEISSGSARLLMLFDYWGLINKSSPYQLLFGHGLGQMNIVWPYDHSEWASLHFSPLEYYYYLGVVIILVLFYFSLLNFKVFTPVLISTLAMSSTLYFIPFYFFLGCFLSKHKRTERLDENFINRTS